MKNIISFSAPGDFGKWEQQCLPIGNAYMGASFFGGIAQEKIVLNEKTLWTGGPAENAEYNGGNKADSYKYVKQVQQLLHDNKYEEALELLPHLTGDCHRFGAYQLLCNAMLTFSNIDETKAENYSRQLDMNNSLYTCSFTYQGAIHKREAFADYPSNVICIRLSSDKPRRICLRLSLDNIQPNGQVGARDNSLYYSGAIADNGLKYAAQFTVVHSGGELLTAKDSVMVEHADSVEIYFSAATDYADKYPTYRNNTDPVGAVNKRLEKAVGMGWDKLFAEHQADYKPLFERVSLSLNNTDYPQIDTDKLVEQYRSGDMTNASALEELYFQFGRYMLISSSRAGTLPANLQGVWNETNCPPWCCDYHINVNLQMNYWGAYNTNLAECALPLIDFLDSMRPAGRVTAKEYYGIESTESNPENGWIAHTQTSPFGWTAPGWDFYWGWSTAAVAWLMQNLWEYYEFTGDKELLKKRIYPIMRESAVFYKQWLIYDDKQDRLVSSPTYSPEHGPVTIGNTYEQSLIEQLYKDFIKAAEILDVDEELRDEIKKQCEMLKPYKVSKTGRLMEWFEEDNEDFDNSKVQPCHRHISHLLGLYPGKAISANTPDLMKAAIATMNHRGDDSTGWARAFKVNLWARTKDGNRAYKLLSGLLSSCTYPNLFDFHPPFQLDGNFGGSAGIAEMLLQSHEGYIEPLAALPSRWSSGEYKGLCARGGFIVDVRWSEGKAESIAITSTLGGICRVKTKLSRLNGKEIAADNGIITFETEKNGVYKIEL
ncbi:MAG: glycosyl hydrolase family 95 catalytic domain-containing protein [Ruminiclostridium sp.]